jgi:hypothetical protein
MAYSAGSLNELSLVAVISEDGMVSSRLLAIHGAFVGVTVVVMGGDWVSVPGVVLVDPSVAVVGVVGVPVEDSVVGDTVTVVAG